MVIKAKRIYEPKKEDNFDIQKVLWEAIQKSITSSTDQTKQLVSEFERMSSDAWVKKLEEKFYQYIKNLRIEKEEIKQDVYKNIENRVNEIWRRVENHEHKEYLTQEDKDECINSAEAMVNEAVLKFDNLFKPFLEQLNTKSDKQHTHIEFEELKKEIEENEGELERKLEKKADKKHVHKIWDIENLKDKLEKKADKEHKHDEYATRQELEFIAMQKARWAGWGGHVIQQSGVVKAQRSNLNFIGATVTDDPNNNATIVTVTWWWSWAVDSVNWQTGVVVLDQDDIGDGATYKQYSDTEKTKLAGIEAWADITDATNVGAAWAFMKATDDTDDIIEGATNLFMDSTEQGKLANITVTQAVDLDQMESDIAALANGMVYKWNWDASVWTFPWAWIAQTWWFYTVSVGGTVDSVVFAVDDRLVATTDNASTTIYAWNWTKLDATDAVTSVNGAVWNVVIDAVLNSDYTPSHSILVQKSWTWSPTALSIGNNTLVGRLSWGGSDIDDLSSTDVRTLLSISNVDNTSDLSKPISTATQTALDLKANLAWATFSGDIIVPTEAYWSWWNGSNEVPTKNDLYDKIETLWWGWTPWWLSWAIQFNDWWSFWWVSWFNYDPSNVNLDYNAITDSWAFTLQITSVDSTKYSIITFIKDYLAFINTVDWVTWEVSITDGIMTLRSNNNNFNFLNSSWILALTNITVEANTDWAGSPNIITDTESSTLFTNEWTTAKNYHTLPTAVAWLTYTFYVADSDWIRVVADTWNFILVNWVSSTSAWYCDSISIWSSITLTAINATDWVATSSIGTRTLG